MKFFLTIALFLLSATTLLAHTEVTETAILGHGDPTPRFSAHYTNKLVVPVGETVTLPATFDYDVIEVSGTLKASREYDTVGKVIHFTVMPGGVLDFGTETDPVLKNVEIIFKDVPLRTGDINNVDIDPYQIGNGLIVFGKFYSHGIKLEKTFTQLKAGVGPNANSVVMDVPAGWKVGDSILLPDTRKPYYVYPKLHSFRKEEGIKIQSIDEDVVVLNKTLEFERELYKDVDGNVRHMPYIANATRNIVFRSENPAGTRGHTIFMEQAEVDVRYTAFLGLGRTLAINIDNTEANSGVITKIGTNQIARYALHWHHVHGHANVGGYTGKEIGCYLGGDNIGKWGSVQHGTHDLYIVENVGYNFPAGAFVTEDGYEVRGIYDHNLAMGCTGNGVNGKFNFVPPRNIPGGEGAGFWFHGIHQKITNNVSVNNSVGYEFLYRNQVTGRTVPSVPGGTNDMNFDPRTAVPLQLENNFALSCHSGIETWNNPKLLFTKLYLFNNHVGYTAGNGEGGRVDLDDFLIVADGLALNNSDAISTSAAYTGNLDIKNGEISGYDVGVHEARSDMFLTNVIMQNNVNVNYHYFRPEHTKLENVTHKQFKDFAKRYVVLGQNQDWKPGDNIPSYGAPWIPSDGKRFIVKNWQGTGKDYLFFENQQRASKPAWYGPQLWYSPEAGLTMGEVWNKYGIAYGGGVVKDEDAVELDGLIYGVGKLGLDADLGVPRATLVYPNVHDKALLYNKEPVDGNLDFHFYLSNNGNTDGKSYFTVDNSSPIEIGPWYTQQHGTYRARNKPEFTSVGTHNVKTWRVDLAGKKIDGSELSFQYFVSEPTPVDPIPIVVSPIEVTPEVVYESTIANYKASATGGNASLTWTTKYTYDGTTVDYSSGSGNNAEWTFNYPAGVRQYTWSITFTDGTQSVTVSKVVDVLAKPNDDTIAELQAKIDELQAKIVELNGTIATLQSQLNDSEDVNTTLQSIIDSFKSKIKQVEQLRLELLQMAE